MMECPESQHLAELLAEDTVSASSELLWNHLEECPRCRAELDRISDDPEMRQWRDRSSVGGIEEGEVDAIAHLVGQLSDRETAVDSIANKTTTAEQGVDRRILESFERSDDPNDLGKLGQFRIKRMLGHGGMAVVFEAIDLELGRAVALKILRTSQSDDSSRERFTREARALAGVKNPNVISIYSVQSNDDQQPLIAMEMVDGGSLQERLQLQQDIQPKNAATWIAEAAEGLAAAHEAGLIHRDIKPSNILLAKHGSSFTAKLADFGLARFTAVEHRATQTGIMLGTPAYMSPEQIAAPESCDRQSDIYSLGVTFYELLTGEVPFRGAVHTVLQRIGRDQPLAPRTLNALIPRDLETVCLKAMHREPARRYSSAQAFADDLKRWLNGQPILARPTTNLEHLIGWCRRNPWVASLTGAIATLLVVLASASTYFALTIQAAGENLKKEKETVEATSKQLKITAADAKAQRQIAVDSLNNLVTKVQAELKQSPGTFKLRGAILDVAVKGLDQITRDSDATDLDLARVMAHIQKGEIYDALGRVDESVVELEKATTLAETYDRQSPFRADIQKTLGDALIAKADVATRRGAVDVAKPLYQRVLPIREAALSLAEEIKDSVTTFNARKAFILVIQRIGDLHYDLGESDQSYAFYNRALQLANVNAIDSPDSLIAKRDLSLAHQRLGSIELMRNHQDASTEHFLEAVKLNRALLASDPENKLYAGDLGYILGELSKLTNAKGDTETALAQAKEAIQQCEKVVAADPTDTNAKLKAAMSWTHLYWIFMAQNKFALAEQSVNKFLERNAKLAEQNPTASKFPTLSVMWLVKIIDLQTRQGKITSIPETSRNIIANLKRWQKAADARPEMLEPAIALHEKTIVGIQWVIEGADLTSDAVSGDLELLYISRLYAIYEAARTGKTETVILLGQKLSDTGSIHPGLTTLGDPVVARAFALCFGKMSKGEEADPQPFQAKKELVLQQSIEHVRKLFSTPEILANPSAKFLLLQDFDFHAIRDQPLFQSLLH